MVIHRDLKSSNILLDKDWAAKISDFGLCKKCIGDRPYTPIVASLKGTYAYMDPKYLTTHELSTKTDVYAFGVVLLEVLCGRRSLDFEVVDRQKRLVLWGVQCINEGVAHRIIDPGLRGRIADNGLHVFLDIAVRCLQDRPKKRPAMAEVVGKLEIALASQYTTYSSSSSVSDEYVKYFSQDSSRYTVETWSSKPDSVKEDLSSESKSTTMNKRHNELKLSSENIGLEVSAELQSNQVKANVTDAATSKSSIRLSHDKDDVFEKLFRRTNPLQIMIDNVASENATVIMVDSTNRQEVLLAVIQVLTDTGLILTKAFMSSDGSWSMNVFLVTDTQGKKVTDFGFLDDIEKVCGSDTSYTASINSSSTDQTFIELIGSDRHGLLSEVCMVLTDLGCIVLNANVWTHNARAAFVIQLTDADSGEAITDPMRLFVIKKRLCSVLSVNNNATEANVVVSHDVINTERRLHQMMLVDHDYERGSNIDLDEKQRPDVKVVNWYDKNCSVVTVRCKDRAKLLFDIICTLTDIDYVVLHGHLVAQGLDVFQEYCIRHVDGSAVKSDAERQRLIQCIEAAIERRVSEGLKLELYTTPSIWLLSRVTRIFRENGLRVKRAEVTTRKGEVVNTFYVCDVSGCLVDSKTIDSIREQIGGQTTLIVEHHPQHLNHTPQQSPSRSLWLSLRRNLYNLGLIRSSS